MVSFFVRRETTVSTVVKRYIKAKGQRRAPLALVEAFAPIIAQQRQENAVIKEEVEVEIPQVHDGVDKTPFIIYKSNRSVRKVGKLIAKNIAIGGENILVFKDYFLVSLSLFVNYFFKQPRISFSFKKNVYFTFSDKKTRVFKRVFKVSRNPVPRNKSTFAPHPAHAGYSEAMLSVPHTVVTSNLRRVPKAILIALQKQLPQVVEHKPVEKRQVTDEALVLLKKQHTVLRSMEVNKARELANIPRRSVVCQKCPSKTERLIAAKDFAEIRAILGTEKLEHLTKAQVQDHFKAAVSYKKANRELCAIAQQTTAAYRQLVARRRITSDERSAARNAAKEECEVIFAEKHALSKERREKWAQKKAQSQKMVPRVPFEERRANWLAQREQSFQKRREAWLKNQEKIEKGRKAKWLKSQKVGKGEKMPSTIFFAKGVSSELRAAAKQRGWFKTPKKFIGPLYEHQYKTPTTMWDLPTEWPKKAIEVEAVAPQEIEGERVQVICTVSNGGHFVQFTPQAKVGKVVKNTTGVFSVVKTYYAGVKLAIKCKQEIEFGSPLFDEVGKLVAVATHRIGKFVCLSEKSVKFNTAESKYGILPLYENWDLPDEKLVKVFNNRGKNCEVLHKEGGSHIAVYDGGNIYQVGHAIDREEELQPGLTGCDKGEVEIFGSKNVVQKEGDIFYFESNAEYISGTPIFSQGKMVSQVTQRSEHKYIVSRSGSKLIEGFKNLLSPYSLLTALLATATSAINCNWSRIENNSVRSDCVNGTLIPNEIFEGNISCLCKGSRRWAYLTPECPKDRSPKRHIVAARFGGPRHGYNCFFNTQEEENIWTGIEQQIAGNVSSGRICSVSMNAKERNATIINCFTPDIVSNIAFGTISDKISVGNSGAEQIKVSEGIMKYAFVLSGSCFLAISRYFVSSKHYVSGTPIFNDKGETISIVTSRIGNKYPIQRKDDVFTAVSYQNHEVRKLVSRTRLLATEFDELKEMIPLEKDWYYTREDGKWHVEKRIENTVVTVPMHCQKTEQNIMMKQTHHHYTDAFSLELFDQEMDGTLMIGSKDSKFKTVIDKNHTITSYGWDGQQLHYQRCYTFWCNYKLVSGTPLFNLNGNCVTVVTSSRGQHYSVAGFYNERGRVTGDSFEVMSGMPGMWYAGFRFETKEQLVAFTQEPKKDPTLKVFALKVRNNTTRIMVSLGGKEIAHIYVDSPMATTFHSDNEPKPGVSNTKEESETKTIIDKVIEGVKGVVAPPKKEEKSEEDKKQKDRGSPKTSSSAYGLRATNIKVNRLEQRVSEADKKIKSLERAVSNLTLNRSRNPTPNRGNWRGRSNSRDSYSRSNSRQTSYDRQSSNRGYSITRSNSRTRDQSYESNRSGYNSQRGNRGNQRGQNTGQRGIRRPMRGNNYRRESNTIQLGFFIKMLIFFLTASALILNVNTAPSVGISTRIDQAQKQANKLSGIIDSYNKFDRVLDSSVGKIMGDYKKMSITIDESIDILTKSKVEGRNYNSLLYSARKVREAIIGNTTTVNTVLKSVENCEKQIQVLTDSIVANIAALNRHSDNLDEVLSKLIYPASRYRRSVNEDSLHGRLLDLEYSMIEMVTVIDRISQDMSDQLYLTQRFHTLEDTMVYGVDAAIPWKTMVKRQITQEQAAKSVDEIKGYYWALGSYNSTDKCDSKKVDYEVEYISALLNIEKICNQNTTEMYLRNSSKHCPMGNSQLVYLNDEYAAERHGGERLIRCNLACLPPSALIELLVRQPKAWGCYMPIISLLVKETKCAYRECEEDGIKVYSDKMLVYIEKTECNFTLSSSAPNKVCGTNVLAPSDAKLDAVYMKGSYVCITPIKDINEKLNDITTKLWSWLTDKKPTTYIGAFLGVIISAYVTKYTNVVLGAFVAALLVTYNPAFANDCFTQVLANYAYTSTTSVLSGTEYHVYANLERSQCVKFGDEYSLYVDEIIELYSYNYKYTTPTQIEIECCDWDYNCPMTGNVCNKEMCKFDKSKKHLKSYTLCQSQKTSPSSTCFESGAMNTFVEAIIKVGENETGYLKIWEIPVNPLEQRVEAELHSTIIPEKKRVTLKRDNTLEDWEQFLLMTLNVHNIQKFKYIAKQYNNYWCAHTLPREPKCISTTYMTPTTFFDEDCLRPQFVWDGDDYTCIVPEAVVDKYLGTYFHLCPTYMKMINNQETLTVEYQHPSAYVEFQTKLRTVTQIYTKCDSVIIRDIEVEKGTTKWYKVSVLTVLGSVTRRCQLKINAGNCEVVGPSTQIVDKSFAAEYKIACGILIPSSLIFELSSGKVQEHPMPSSVFIDIDFAIVQNWNKLKARIVATNTTWFENMFSGIGDFFNLSIYFSKIKSLLSIVLGLVFAYFGLLAFAGGNHLVGALFLIADVGLYELYRRAEGVILANTMCQFNLMLYKMANCVAVGVPVEDEDHSILVAEFIIDVLYALLLNNVVYNFNIFVKVIIASIMILVWVDRNPLSSIKHLWVNNRVCIGQEIRQYNWLAIHFAQLIPNKTWVDKSSSNYVSVPNDHPTISQYRLTNDNDIDIDTKFIDGCRKIYMSHKDKETNGMIIFKHNNIYFSGYKLIDAHKDEHIIFIFALHTLFNRQIDYSVFKVSDLYLVASDEEVKTSNLIDVSKELVDKHMGMDYSVEHEEVTIGYLNFKDFRSKAKYEELKLEIEVKKLQTQFECRLFNNGELKSFLGLSGLPIRLNNCFFIQKSENKDFVSTLYCDSFENNRTEFDALKEYAPTIEGKVEVPRGEGINTWVMRSTIETLCEVGDQSDIVVCVHNNNVNSSDYVKIKDINATYIHGNNFESKMKEFKLSNIYPWFILGDSAYEDVSSFIEFLKSKAKDLEMFFVVVYSHKYTTEFDFSLYIGGLMYDCIDSSVSGSEGDLTVVQETESLTSVEKVEDNIKKQFSYNPCQWVSRENLLFNLFFDAVDDQPFEMRLYKMTSDTNVSYRIVLPQAEKMSNVFRFLKIDNQRVEYNDYKLLANFIGILALGGRAIHICCKDAEDLQEVLNGLSKVNKIRVIANDIKLFISLTSNQLEELDTLVQAYSLPSTKRWPDNGDAWSAILDPIEAVVINGALTKSKVIKDVSVVDTSELPQQLRADYCYTAVLTSGCSVGRAFGRGRSLITNNHVVKKGNVYFNDKNSWKLLGETSTTFQWKDPDIDETHDVANFNDMEIVNPIIGNLYAVTDLQVKKTLWVICEQVKGQVDNLQGCYSMFRPVNIDFNLRKIEYMYWKLHPGMSGLPIINEVGECVGIYGYSCDIADTRNTKAYTILTTPMETKIDYTNYFNDCVDQLKKALLAPSQLYHMVVAPTGSGKTTTMTMALAEATPGRNILLLEPLVAAAKNAYNVFVTVIKSRRLEDEITVRLRVGQRNEENTNQYGHGHTRIDVFTAGKYNAMRETLATEYTYILLDEVHVRNDPTVVEAQLHLAKKGNYGRMESDMNVVVYLTATDVGFSNRGNVLGRGNLPGARYVIRDELLQEAPSAKHIRGYILLTMKDLGNHHLLKKTYMVSEELMKAGRVIIFVHTVKATAALATQIRDQMPNHTVVQYYAGCGLDFNQLSKNAIIVSTDALGIAVTVVGCRLVVDFCLEMKPNVVLSVPAPNGGEGTYKYEASLDMKETSIQASEQRKGRTGRTEPGVYMKLDIKQTSQDMWDISVFPRVALSIISRTQSVVDYEGYVKLIGFEDARNILMEYKVLHPIYHMTEGDPNLRLRLALEAQGDPVGIYLKSIISEEWLEKQRSNKPDDIKFHHKGIATQNKSWAEDLWRTYKSEMKVKTENEAIIKMKQINKYAYSQFNDIADSEWRKLLDAKLLSFDSQQINNYLKKVEKISKSLENPKETFSPVKVTAGTSTESLLWEGGVCIAALGALLGVTVMGAYAVDLRGARYMKSLSYTEVVNLAGSAKSFENYTNEDMEAVSIIGVIFERVKTFLIRYYSLIKNWFKDKFSKNNSNSSTESATIAAYIETAKAWTIANLPWIASGGSIAAVGSGVVTGAILDSFVRTYGRVMGTIACACLTGVLTVSTGIVPGIIGLATTVVTYLVANIGQASENRYGQQVSGNNGSVLLGGGITGLAAGVVFMNELRQIFISNNSPLRMTLASGVTTQATNVSIILQQNWLATAVLIYRLVSELITNTDPNNRRGDNENSQDNVTKVSYIVSILVSLARSGRFDLLKIALGVIMLVLMRYLCYLMQRESIATGGQLKQPAAYTDWRDIHNISKSEWFETFVSMLGIVGEPASVITIVLHTIFVGVTDGELGIGKFKEIFNTYAGVNPFVYVITQAFAQLWQVFSNRGNTESAFGFAALISLVLGLPATIEWWIKKMKDWKNEATSTESACLINSIIPDVVDDKQLDIGTYISSYCTNILNNKNSLPADKRIAFMYERNNWRFVKKGTDDYKIIWVVVKRSIETAAINDNKLAHTIKDAAVFDQLIVSVIEDIQSNKLNMTQWVKYFWDKIKWCFSKVKVFVNWLVSIIQRCCTKIGNWLSGTSSKAVYSIGVNVRRGFLGQSYQEVEDHVPKLDYSAYYSNTVVDPGEEMKVFMAHLITEPTPLCYYFSDIFSSVGITSEQGGVYYFSSSNPPRITDDVVIASVKTAFPLFALRIQPMRLTTILARWGNAILEGGSVIFTVPNYGFEIKMTIGWSYDTLTVTMVVEQSTYLHIVLTRNETERGNAIIVTWGPLHEFSKKILSEVDRIWANQKFLPAVNYTKYDSSMHISNVQSDLVLLELVSGKRSSNYFNSWARKALTYGKGAIAKTIRYDPEIVLQQLTNIAPSLHKKIRRNIAEWTDGTLRLALGGEYNASMLIEQMSRPRNELEGLLKKDLTIPNGWIELKKETIDEMLKGWQTKPKRHCPKANINSEDELIIYPVNKKNLTVLASSVKIEELLSEVPYNYMSDDYSGLEVVSKSYLEWAKNTNIRVIRNVGTRYCISSSIGICKCWLLYSADTTCITLFLRDGCHSASLIKKSDAEAFKMVIVQQISNFIRINNKEVTNSISSALLNPIVNLTMPPGIESNTTGDEIFRCQPHSDSSFISHYDDGLPYQEVGMCIDGELLEEPLGEEPPIFKVDITKTNKENESIINYLGDGLMRLISGIGSRVSEKLTYVHYTKDDIQNYVERVQNSYLEEEDDEWYEALEEHKDEKPRLASFELLDSSKTLKELPYHPSVYNSNEIKEKISQGDPLNEYKIWLQKCLSEFERLSTKDKEKIKYYGRIMPPQIEREGASRLATVASKGFYHWQDIIEQMPMILEQKVSIYDVASGAGGLCQYLSWLGTQPNQPKRIVYYNTLVRLQHAQPSVETITIKDSKTTLVSLMHKLRDNDIREDYTLNRMKEQIPPDLIFFDCAEGEKDIGASKKWLHNRYGYALAKGKDPSYNAFVEALSSHGINRIVKYRQKDILNNKNKVIIHCVSQDKQMSSGLAEQIVKKYGKSMRKAHIFKSDVDNNTIVNMVTKLNYNDKPTYESLFKALEETLLMIKDNKITVPFLGCGQDKLEWTYVRSILGYLGEKYGKTFIVNDIRPEPPQKNIRGCRNYLETYLEMIKMLVNGGNMVIRFAGITSESTNDLFRLLNISSKDDTYISFKKVYVYKSRTSPNTSPSWYLILYNKMVVRSKIGGVYSLEMCQAIVSEIRTKLSNLLQSAVYHAKNPLKYNHGYIERYDWIRLKEKEVRIIQSPATFVSAEKARPLSFGIEFNKGNFGSALALVKKSQFGPNNIEITPEKVTIIYDHNWDERLKLIVEETRKLDKSKLVIAKHAREWKQLYGLGTFPKLTSSMDKGVKHIQNGYIAEFTERVFGLKASNSAYGFTQSTADFTNASYDTRIDRDPGNPDAKYFRNYLSAMDSLRTEYGKSLIGKCRVLMPDEVRLMMRNKGAVGKLDDGGNLQGYIEQHPDWYELAFKHRILPWSKQQPTAQIMTMRNKRETKLRKDINSETGRLKYEQGTVDSSTLLENGDMVPRQIVFADSLSRLAHIILLGDLVYKHGDNKTYQGSFTGTPPQIQGRVINKIAEHVLGTETHYDRLVDCYYEELSDHNKNKKTKCDQLGVILIDFSKFDFTQTPADRVAETLHIAEYYEDPQIQQAIIGMGQEFTFPIVINDQGDIVGKRGSRSSGEILTSYGNTLQANAHLRCAISEITGISNKQLSEKFANLYYYVGGGYQPEFKTDDPVQEIKREANRTTYILGTDKNKKWKKIELGIISLFCDGDDCFIIAPRDTAKQLAGRLDRVVIKGNKILRAGDQAGVLYKDDIRDIFFCSHKYRPVLVDVIPLPIKYINVDKTREMIKRGEKTELVNPKIYYLQTRPDCLVLGKLPNTLKVVTKNFDISNLEAIKITRSKVLSYLLLYPHQRVIRDSTISMLSLVGEGNVDMSDQWRTKDFELKDHTIRGALKSIYGVDSFENISCCEYTEEISSLRDLNYNARLIGLTSPINLKDTRVRILNWLIETSQKYLLKVDINILSMNKAMIKVYDRIK